MNKQLYSLQYFNESTGEWCGAGASGRFLPPIQDAMRDAKILCANTVTFRIVHTDA